MGTSGDILDSYLDLLKTKEMCDVTFLVGSTKEKISCHKLILTARSPVFKTMFGERWANKRLKGSSGDEIGLPDAKPHIFKMFLEFLYAGKTSEGVVVDEISDIVNLLYLAEKYNVSNLVGKFEVMMNSKLRVATVVKIHSVAERFHLPVLQSTAEKLATRDLSQLILDPSFESMDAKLLQVCVKDCAVKEIDVFKGLMKWAEARCKESGTEIVGPNLRKVLQEILPHVRFPRMNIQDFRNVVVPTKILTPVELLDVYDHLALDTLGRTEYKTGIFNSAARLSPYARQTKPLTLPQLRKQRAQRT